MKLLQQTFITALILFTSIHTEAQRDNTLEMMSVRFDVVNSEYIKHFYYKVYNRKTIYSEVELSKNISEVDLKVVFAIVRKDKTRVNLVNQMADGCESLQNAQKIRLLKVIFQEMLDASNLPKKCPLLANFRYVFKNYTLNDDNYPSSLPTFNWQFKIDFILMKKLAINVTINGRIRKL